MPTPADPSTFAALVLSIYKAAEDSAVWGDVMESLRAALDGTGATLMHLDTRRPSSILATTVGYSPEDVRLYQDYYSHVDPWGLGLAMHPYDPGQAIDGRALAPDAVVRRSEYFADFGRRVGSGRSACVPIERSSERLALAVVARSHAQPDFEQSHLDLLERLAPHLQQAFRIHRRLSLAEHGHAATASVLDRLPIGVLLFDGTGKVLTANTAAQAILTAADGVTLEHGRICGTRTGVTRLFDEALARATGTGPLTVRSASSFAIERSSCRAPYRVVVAPAGDDLTTAVDGLAQVVVYISDADVSSVVHPDALVALFGLTRAEASVTALLVGGRTSDAIAAELGIKVSTARWHIKQVLQKLHVSSQAQLVALVLRSPAQLR